MRRVAKAPLILDVLNIENVQRSLDRLADLLSKIQKARQAKTRHTFFFF